ncbi:MAG: metallophosphoesterase family protein [Spirochaetales bacterium]|nr:metallophosphoesterase family protein [Spirochaetales bacterium]
MKKRVLGFTIILAMLLGSCMSSIEKSYAFNDGPWLIKQDASEKYIISWLTSTARDSTIYWGESPYDLKNKFVSEKARVHRLELSNLAPGKYYYTVVEDLTNFPKGHVFSFNAGYPARTKIAIIGDVQIRTIQTTKMAKIMAESIEREKPDAVIQLGDLVEVPRFNTSWHVSLKPTALYTGERPFYSAAGNHEQINGDAVNYKQLFPHDFASEEATYYSFTIKDAFFIQMDFCDDGYEKVSKKQAEWIEQELIKAKERNMKWVFILFHGNLFDTHPLKRQSDVQKWLVPLADKYEVDGVFTGHSHGYQFWEYAYGHDDLLYNKEDKPTGKKIPYWCTAAGGAALRVNYGLLNFDTNDSIEMFNRKTGEMETIEILQGKWNSKKFIDYRDNKYYGQPFIGAGKHFYHDPSIESYCSDNERLGFVYGEQTSHYMLIELEEGKCHISARYSDGKVLSGPNKDKPQEWTFEK